MRVDVDFAVKESNFPASGLCFGQSKTCVGLVEEDLALQIALLDEVAVDEGECSHSGARKQACRGSASRSAAYNRNMCRLQFLLSLGADSGIQNLAGVPLC